MDDIGEYLDRFHVFVQQCSVCHKRCVRGVDKLICLLICIGKVLVRMTFARHVSIVGTSSFTNGDNLALVQVK